MLTEVNKGAAKELQRLARKAVKTIEVGDFFPISVTPVAPHVAIVLSLDSARGEFIVHELYSLFTDDRASLLDGSYTYSEELALEIYFKKISAFKD